MPDFSALLEQNATFLIRLVVAMVLGALVGMERQSRGRAAGLRTNILVCLGSAAIIVAFRKLAMESNLDADSAIRMDPARAAAGVITGIGFLGAGTIVKSQNFIRGLTTAASIWVVSAIGVTVGLGEYVIASALTLLVLLSLYLLHRVPIKGDRYFTLQLKWVGEPDLIQEVIGMLEAEGAQFKNRSFVREPKLGLSRVRLDMRLGKDGEEIATVQKLQSDKRFDEVRWD